MAENNPAARPSASGHKQMMAVGLIRLLWPLPGAITGAAVSFHLFFRQPGLNTDTAAPLIFASLWAFGGMLAGMLSTSLAAWLVERSVRRWFGIGPLFAASLALFCLTGLCLGLYAPLEARLPALFWPAPQNALSRPPAPPQPSPCAQAPPAELKARKSWDLECR